MRNRYVLLADLPLIALAAFGAFALRFDLFFISYREEFPSFLIAAIVVKPVIYSALGMYPGYWPYGNSADVLMIVLANGTASLALGIVLAAGTFLHVVPGFPRTALLIDGGLALMLTGGFPLANPLAGQKPER